MAGLCAGYLLAAAAEHSGGERQLRPGPGLVPRQLARPAPLVVAPPRRLAQDETCLEIRGLWIVHHLLREPVKKKVWKITQLGWGSGPSGPGHFPHFQNIKN